MHVWVPHHMHEVPGPEEGVRSSVTGLLAAMWLHGIEPASSEVYQVLLTSEPSLNPTGTVFS